MDIADEGVGVIGGGFEEAEEGKAGRPGLLGSAIDGIWEDEFVADDERIVDEAFDGLRPIRGRRALGGGG